MIAGDDLTLYMAILARLKAAGQWRWCRGRPPHPPFKGAEQATDRLLAHLPPDSPVLVMRDQVLRPVRVAVLRSGRPLLVPDDLGQVLYRIPPGSLKYQIPGAITAHLRIDPLPYGSAEWRGPVGMIVVGCTAWSRDRRQLWSLDWDSTAGTLDELQGGETDDDRAVWRLSRDVPVACIAADEQEISETWPGWAIGHRADVVFTPTRTVILGDDRTQGHDPNQHQGMA